MVDSVRARPSETGSREPDPQAVPALSGLDPARKGEPYIVLKDRILHGETLAVAGELVWRFTGYDYGLARDDTMYIGGAHVSVTKDGVSCFTILLTDLCEIPRDAAIAMEARQGGDGEAGSVHDSAAIAQPTNPTPQSDERIGE